MLLGQKSYRTPTSRDTEIFQLLCQLYDFESKNSITVNNSCIDPIYIFQQKSLFREEVSRFEQNLTLQMKKENLFFNFCKNGQSEDFSLQFNQMCESTDNYSVNWCHTPQHQRYNINTSLFPKILNRDLVFPNQRLSEVVGKIYEPNLQKNEFKGISSNSTNVEKLKNDLNGQTMEFNNNDLKNKNEILQKEIITSEKGKTTKLKFCLPNVLKKLVKNKKEVYILRPENNYDRKKSRMLRLAKIRQVVSNSTTKNNQKQIIFIIEKVKNKENQESDVSLATQEPELKKEKRMFCLETQSKQGRGSHYRGVSRNGNLWQVLIMIDKKKRYVGSYHAEESAARAYDRAAIQYHQAKAKTNFLYKEEEIEKIISDKPIIAISKI
jgi:hypothetical protein